MAGNIIEDLNRTNKRLSKGHKKIADFIRENYDKAAFMTASKLSDVVGVSESTVVRFAMALGYEGYPQMQQTLQEIMRHRLTSAQRFDMTLKMTQGETIQSVFSADIHNIKDAMLNIDPKVFNDVVEAISSAKSIYVLGLRSAAPLADFFAHYLYYIFDDVNVVMARSRAIYESMVRIKKGDCLIAISFPRYSTRTLESMRLARSKGAKVIGITDGALSPLHEESDLCLDASTRISSFVDSMAAPLALVNALLTEIGKRNEDALKKNLSDLEVLWQENKVYAGNE
ncbi:MAG: MurR/RpiR family transcriptional regulator [Eubacteriales bacterium]|nr:MurR/RpiR family transcriptional regulator [Eubacteriales bacterium]